MPATVTLRASIVDEPAEKSTATGLAYTVARAADDCDGDAVDWLLIAFDLDPRNTLAALHAGDDVEVAGEFKARRLGDLRQPRFVLHVARVEQVAKSTPRRPRRKAAETA